MPPTTELSHNRPHIHLGSTTAGDHIDLVLHQGQSKNRIDVFHFVHLVDQKGKIR